MRKTRFGITYWLAALSVIFVAGCGQETVIVPSVVSTTPANGAPNVVVNTPISATFSMAMKAATITASTFTVTGPGGAVTGTVTYSGLTATFTPSAALAYATSYTGTITAGAENVGGTPLTANYVWTFTTITPPPAVITTVPVSAATGVPIGEALSATFNEAIQCSTLVSPAATFIVAGPGGVAVAGAVSCAGSVATFTPSAVLAVNTVYTATITTGVLDLAGTPLASNYVWTFRTVPATTSPTVISTLPVNGAPAWPINRALTATFSAAMEVSTIDAATFTLKGPGGVAVTGVVTYVASGSVATFTPAAILTSSTAYTATITTGAMNLDGTAMVQNYVWTFTTAAVPINTPPTVISTIPSNAAPDVPLNQVVNASFSEPMNPATISSATFTLTGPGGSAVSGLVAYAAIADSLTFTPTSNLAPSTLFTATITTGVTDLAGKAMATNYVWTFTTGTTLATAAPELVSAVPANEAIGVPLNQAVSATFSEAMNPLTITTATFQLYSGTGLGGTPIAGTVSYDSINLIATFTPTDPLTTSTTYTATVTNGATDVDGNPLGTTGAQNPWSFTTGTALVTPPVVLGSTISLFGGLGGGAGMTNQGIHTVINGDIATTGASSLITGFHDTSLPIVGAVWPCSYTETPLDIGQVNGVIDTAAPPPTVNCPDEGTALTMALATQAALEARTAYTTLQGLPSDGVLAAEVGGTTIYPGVYTNGSSVSILNGDLTLDARGDPNAFWVFQIGSSLTVGDPVGPQTRSVILAGGAKASNIFWAVGALPGAIINYGGGGTMAGTIIAQQAITISSPGQSTSSTVTTINGRVLALGASVTMVNTVINVPAQ